MFLLLASFFAGMLTSLAPCMITLLPVIVGNSILAGKGKELDYKKPYIIAASLSISVILFTVLLKTSTILIGVDPSVWLYISGGIVALLGISMLFPRVWARVSTVLGFENGSNTFLVRASKRSGVYGHILTGAALGPVFSSCSPVYALVLATILPVNFALGMVYIVSFAIGLGFALLLIALGGQRIVRQLGWTANPDGWFRKALAILLIVVGFGIIGGYDKTFQAWSIQHLPFNFSSLEEKLIEKRTTPTEGMLTTHATMFNVITPYQAPELQGIQGWINSNPQTLAGLKGKVVLIDFWTYSCINCIRTQPYLNAWYKKYQDKGFVILGIHAPEFSFEKVKKNVDEAVAKAGIAYPVALDNAFATWNAYENRFWPAKYLIDKDGLVRYTHFGEGGYAETEGAIQALLAETGSMVSGSVIGESSAMEGRTKKTPETYLNYSRGERLVNAEKVQKDAWSRYVLASNLKSNEWSLGGNWMIGQESSLSGANAEVKIRFSGKQVYLVMSGPAGSKIRAFLDEKPLIKNAGGGLDVDSGGVVMLENARLYHIVDSSVGLEDKELLLRFSPGITINAFTFGG